MNDPRSRAIEAIYWKLGRTGLFDSWMVETLWDLAEQCLHAMHGIVRVVPAEANKDMLEAATDHYEGDNAGIFAAMAAAGDLTRKKDGKDEKIFVG